MNFVQCVGLDRGSASSIAASAADTNNNENGGLDADANDGWTLSVHSMESHNVESEAIAACHKLSNSWHHDLALASQNPAPPGESNSEICAAHVLASLSAASVDDGQPKRQVEVSRKGRLAANERRRSSARRVSESNCVSAERQSTATTESSQCSQLSTINMSDIDSLSSRACLSPVAKVPRKNFSALRAALATGKSQSLATSGMSAAGRENTGTSEIPVEIASALRTSVTKSRSPALATVAVPETTMKHTCHRPMKLTSNVNIRYDEVSRRYVQTVKKSTDRRRSLAYPGYRPSTEAKENKPENVETGLRVTTRGGNVATSTNVGTGRSPSKLSGDAVGSANVLCCVDGAECGDLSSMEIVTRFCLGDSKTPTEFAQSKPPPPPQTEVEAVSKRTRRTRSSQESGTEATSTAAGGKTASLDRKGMDVIATDVVDRPESSSSRSGRSTRNRKKAEKSVASDANGRQPEKKSGKARSTRSPRKSDAGSSEQDFSSLSAIGRGRKKASDKPPKTSPGRKNSATARKGRTAATKKTRSPPKSPKTSGRSPKSLSSKRKRKSSPAKETVEPSDKQQSTECRVSLPDIKCFLTDMHNDSGATVNTLQSSSDVFLSGDGPSDVMSNSADKVERNTLSIAADRDDESAPVSTPVAPVHSDVNACSSTSEPG